MSLCDDPKVSVIKVVTITFVALLLPQNLYTIIALYIRPTNDILQGINRLDYLIVISCF